MCFFFFFFSSRRRHTRCSRDWSSDVCSSDLAFRKAYIGLGRHPLSDVRFDVDRDLDVSSRHAGIVRHGETFMVRDLGSTNGTFVNGARISGDVVLADGDVIGLGQNGPAVEFHTLPGEPIADTVPDSTRASAERLSSSREQYAAVAAPA